MLYKKYLSIAAVFTLLVSGCSNSPAVVVKAVTGNQTVTAKTGKSFSIQLEAQMSTGYSWKLAEVPESMQIIKENVKTGEKDIAGGIDIQEFILKSSAKGEFTLTFRYGEHWKEKPQYVKTSVVKVVIN